MCRWRLTGRDADSVVLSVMHVRELYLGHRLDLLV